MIQSCRFSQKSKASLFLLSGIGFAILPHISFQPLSVIVIAGLCLVWRTAELLELLAPPPKFVQMVIAATAIIVIMHGQHYNLGRDAGISLLIAALAIKQIQHHDELNFNFSVCMAYFVSAAVFLYDHSLSSFFCAGQAVVFVSLALYASSAYESALTQKISSINYSAVASRLLYATPLTLIMFFLAPGLKGPLWELPDDAYKAQTGLSSEMAPGKISSLSESNEVVFRAKFKQLPKDIESLYWRGPVFTYFDGQVWQSSGDSIKDSQNEVKPAIDSRDPAKAIFTDKLAVSDAAFKRDDNEYQVILEPQYNQWLFTLATPEKLKRGFYLTAEDELLSKTIINRPLKYTLNVVFTRSVNNETPEKRRYLRLPNLYSPKTKSLVKQLLLDLDPGLPFDAQFVSKVLDYFRRNPFYYSKKPPRLKYDPVDEFMLKTRTGFCEHYASAFTFMMRAAGIPARIVTGYRGGEYNSVGGYVIVRQSDAHAWSEVWLKGKGWVKVDPTTVIPPFRVMHDNDSSYLLAGFAMWNKGTLRELSNWLDNLSYRWYGFWAMVFQARTDNAFAEFVGQSKQYVLIFLLLLLIALLARQRIFHFVNKKDPVVEAYDMYCRKLSRLGLARLPYESASGYALRVCKIRPDLEEGVQRIASLYNRLRYGKQPDQAVYRRFCREVDDFCP